MNATDNAPPAAVLSANAGPDRHTLTQALRAKAEAIVRRIAAWRRCRHARLELGAMSAHEAHDLGLETGAARFMATQPCSSI